MLDYWSLMLEFHRLKRERLISSLADTNARIEQSKLTLAIAKHQLKSSEKTIKATNQLFYQL